MFDDEISFELGSFEFLVWVGHGVEFFQTHDNNKMVWVAFECGYKPWWCGGHRLWKGGGGFRLFGHRNYISVWLYLIRWYCLATMILTPHIMWRGAADMLFFIELAFFIGHHKLNSCSTNNFVTDVFYFIFLLKFAHTQPPSLAAESQKLTTSPSAATTSPLRPGR